MSEKLIYNNLDSICVEILNEDLYNYAHFLSNKQRSDPKIREAFLQLFLETVLNVEDDRFCNFKYFKELTEEQKGDKIVIKVIEKCKGRIKKVTK